MPAFLDDELDAILVQTAGMSDKHRGFVRCPLTHDDVLQTFVEAEHHHIVAQCASLFPRLQETTTWTDIRSRAGHDFRLVSVTVDGNAPYPLPDYAGIPVAGAPKHLARIVEDTMAELETLCLQYGHLKLVLQALDELCVNPAQVRFFFPGIEPLVNRLEDTGTKRKLIKRLNTRSREPLPAMPMELRAEVQRAAATVTGFGMLPDPTPNTDPVRIQVYSRRQFKGSCLIGEYEGV